ncbi:hypothetical protein DPMN_145213 [Dreissena polymorpha]|uniref:Uncharacterized protein n=1 Tax=Dreissena polymorpha TaxID=45954 RepID=A0A9D4F3J3_DREPO|nr:hypothetical protein DPMN_145213 [Dreissena polymorpha]
MMKVGIECYGLSARAEEIFVASGGDSVNEARAQLLVYKSTVFLGRFIKSGADTKPI